ncbi:MAG: hypothetical protein WD941_00300, partial [Opitutus sp.]
MSDDGPLFHRAARWCAGTAGSFALWTLWLALIVVLVLQLYIASRNELTLPDLVLQRMERQIADTGLRAEFDHSSVDPRGRILLHNVRISVTGFSDPVVTARAIYVELNPWMLAVGRFEPREIRISGAVAIVPGRLSPSAAPEELLRDLEITLLPGSRSLEIAELGGRMATMTVSARGIVPLPRSRAGFDPHVIARFIERHVADISREALAWTSRLRMLKQPALHLEFAPSESGAPMVDATLSARGLDLPSPAVQTGDLRISTRALFLGELMVSRIDFAVASVRTPSFGGTTAEKIRGVAHGRMQPGRFHFEAREIELAADTLTAAGISAAALSAGIWPGLLPRIDAHITALVGGEPVTLQANADIAERRAALRA